VDEALRCSSALSRAADENAGLFGTNAARGSAPRVAASAKMRFALAVMFAMFNQLAGINAIIYSRARHFEMTGQPAACRRSASAGSNSSLPTGARHIRTGAWRRKLTLVGSSGLLPRQLVASMFHMQVRRHAGAGAVQHRFSALSQGASIHKRFSEIFPSGTISQAPSSSIGTCDGHGHYSLSSHCQKSRWEHVQSSVSAMVPETDLWKMMPENEARRWG
jgi:hypothetical protein